MIEWKNRLTYSLSTPRNTALNETQYEYFGFSDVSYFIIGQGFKPATRAPVNLIGTGSEGFTDIFSK